ncbi:CHY zinc finger domain-containing protein [Salpingoeca rosetta]|uniref:CHY zinc finger domain-containing protein n=1 Tax=Salpingoeca rosetta (strain ATCC 50818 / BSB-021) TaxID=946362 RepID=F2UL15_SALR5|nr:CHY zinc finger domain-containing protein [Salpingoeca rosetta]EGD77814.1 CHY zinc finger domain-containing protein [Salpingoeca rosetta]|eukprot:XP_004990290.1 CHY zinc finger domain-containing protein [Salpingoeca rosetta]
MCKHILNAQVAIRAPCCKKWYDCPECHEEKADHPLKKSYEMVFACKKCKKVFRKDTREYEEADEYCPHCDNHYVIPAKTPELRIEVEGEQGDHRMIRDERDPDRARRADNSIFGNGQIGFLNK